MEIQTDEIRYHLNLTRVSQHLKTWWKAHEHDTDVIETADGRKIDFSRKSLARVALKTAITPIVIPCMRMLYATKGAEPREHIKHEDMLDYAIDCLLGFIAVLDDGELYVETVERDGSYYRHIQSISTHAPIAQLNGRAQEAAREESSVSPRGEALVYRRENRDGENSSDETGDTSET